MKLTTVLILVMTLQLSATVYSQNVKMNLQLSNATLLELLKSIESSSDYKFFYNNDEIDVTQKVTVNALDKEVGAILKDVFENTPYSFKMMKNNLIILENTSKTGLSVSEQQKTITGKVTDSSGSPLPGVTVVVKGTTTGIITDAYGNYSLANVSSNAMLVFSFVGMKSQEISAEGKTTINVTMDEEIVGIEEVVAIGYGTVKKKDLTGSISRVKSDELLRPSVSTFDQMLQGKVAGVQISQTSGAPGGGNVNILVRGVSSITGGNQPLYVIDGFPVNVGEGNSNQTNYGTSSYSSSGMTSNASLSMINPLSSVNPSDIESIEILKDASATAIYGSRGSNGVIIITTKRGSSAKSQVKVDVSYGVQEVSKKLDLMNSQQYAAFVVEGRDNAWIYSGGKASDPNSVRSQSYRVPDAFRNPSSITTNTDWQDVIFRVAPVQNYQVSASGGNEKLKYLISGGYFNQEGIILTSDYQKFNVRSNVDVQVFEHLKVGSTISGYYGYGNYPNTSGHYAFGDVLMIALAASPTIPVYDTNGDPYFNQDDVTNGLGWLVNPLTVLNRRNYSDKRTQSNVMVNNYLEFNILKGLLLKSSIGINYNGESTKLWRSSAVPYSSSTYPSTAAALKSDNIDWLNENTLSYKHIFKEKHSFDALFGFTAQKNTGESLSAGAISFPTDYVTYIGAGTVNTGSHYKSEWSMLSLISRINYSYAGKYLLTATVRRDGSSRFGANHKWGTFPSFAAGYNISEESFMKSVAFINNLKLRASYGIAGNNQIGNYTTIGLLSSANYVNNGTKLPGLVPRSMSNDDLGWEKSKQFDIGLDLGLFKDRISVIADIYKNKKTDLLLDVNLPAASGYSSSTQNVGEIENKGVELSLQTQNIKSKDFNWTSNFTFSANKNKVLKLATEGGRITNSTYQITQVGLPISSFYLMNVIGVFQNSDEIANSALQDPKVQPGDLKFEDVNKDGKITALDKKIVGNPWPDYTWGFNNKFSYKNLSLSISLNGSNGADTYFQAGSIVMNNAGVQNQIASHALNRWRSETNPGDGMTPRSIRSNYAYGMTDYTTQFLFDASYVRIKDINLSYTIPRSIINRLYLSSLTVYADVANVFTFTDYPGYDPESSTAGNSITNSGIDYLTYPMARTYTIGLKLTF